jgi:RNA polymerase sigma-70 factor (ECF subfamily)
MSLEQGANNAGRPPLNDEAAIALIKKISDGNLSALMTLYDRTSPLLFGLILRILGDRASAEEALLDVYTQVWKNPPSCDAIVPPLHWLISLAHTSALERLHLGKREPARQAAAPGSGTAPVTVAPDLQKLAHSSLESVPTAQRELLEQTYYRGLCSSEMAALIGKPVGAVRTLLRFGLSRIGESFGTVTGG